MSQNVQRGAYSIGYIAGTAWVLTTVMHGAPWWLDVPIFVGIYLAGGVYVEWASQRAAQRREAKQGQP